MNVILALVKNQHVLHYIDNITSLCKTPEVYFKYINGALRILAKASYRIKPRKCHLYGKSIDNLERVIPPGKLQVTRKTIEVIARLQCPTNISGVGFFSRTLYCFWNVCA